MTGIIIDKFGILWNNKLVMTIDEIIENDMSIVFERDCDRYRTIHNQSGLSITHPLEEVVELKLEIK
jgi:hypothetical protein